MHVQIGYYINKGGISMNRLNLRIDDDVRREAEQALKEMGLTLTSAITVFLTKVGREKRMPFEINVDPFYSEQNMAELKRRIESVENGTSKLIEHELIGVDD